jgi:arylsulfatase A-like enzyme
MNRYLFSCILLAFGAARTGATAPAAPVARPNLLWITAEDICPNLGCYGDADAVTPQLDRFAREALRFTRAYSIHPCCSPSRSALVTGLYPTRLGTFQHRGKVKVPADLARCFPALLRAAGYYTFNGSSGATAKLDYNFLPLDQPWDKVGSKEIEWQARRPGQPFFGQLNLGCTHQSQYGRPLPGAKGGGGKAAAARVHDPARVRVPPYHPDTPAVREIWRQYHDRVTQMDGEFGALLQMLAADGLADDTIVFFFGDNGHGIPGGKIWLWDEGIHVPLLVRFPPKWAHLAGATGARGVTDRLVSFVDFAPTMLALAGVPAPAAMQGQAFLGPQAAAPRARVFAARDFHDNADFDTSRAVREGDYLYIRNFMPHLGWDAILYSWETAPAMLEEWRQRAAAGALKAETRQAAFFRRSKPVEELYDLTTDPGQLRNLAAQPEQQATLARLRRECEQWMLANHDLGLLSQYELYTRSAADSPGAMAPDPRRNPTAELLTAATLAGRRDPASQAQLRELLRHPDGAVRRWGAIGLHALGEQAAQAREALLAALADPAPDVRMTAAEALFALGEGEKALPVLVALLRHPSRILRNETLLALCRIGPQARGALPHLAAAAEPSALHNGLWSSDNIPKAVQLARACLDEDSQDPIRLTRQRYLP